jgi:chemotaxis protein MotA
MDILSFAGVVVSFVAILGGNAIEGGHLGALL